MKASTYEVVTIAPRYADAANSISKPGDCAVVERAGTRRQLVICCPDGCGEILSINLDPRSGPAWRLYRKRNAWSLFPSIDRPTGCLSHFILWSGRVMWCGPEDEDSGAPEIPEISAERILDALGDRPTGFVQVADNLDEIPWDVLGACRKLVRQGLLQEGLGKQRGNFWKRAAESRSDTAMRP
jgi:hypothetical protein